MSIGAFLNNTIEDFLHEDQEHKPVTFFLHRYGAHMEDLVVNGLDVKPINYIAEKVVLIYLKVPSIKSHLPTDFWPWIQLCAACLCPRHHLYGSCRQG